MAQINQLKTIPPDSVKKKDIIKKTSKMAKKIGELCRVLQADGQQSILVVLQGMDASGKDGVTREVFKYCSPSAVCAVGYKKPTPEEFAHDFLWRVHKHAPAKGSIKVFIRSHYEDVLIQRVHHWIDEERVDARFEAINAFENLLIKDNNTTVLKFFLHISPERQLEKLQERKEEPDKFFKHNPGDWEERKYWNEYMKCYQDVLDRSAIPWHIIPADARWYRNYMVAKEVLKTLEGFNLKYPPLKQD